jgi:hypothetical protein
MPTGLHPWISSSFRQWHLNDCSCLSSWGSDAVAFYGSTNPTAEWLARQIAEAFPWDTVPGFIIGDNDGAYGEAFTRRLRAMGIRDRPIAPRSPWQNGYVERSIGSIRRECLDHVIIWGEAHLRHVLQAYTAY